MFYRSSSDLLRLDRISSYLRKTSGNKRSQGEGKEASSSSDLLRLDRKSSYLRETPGNKRSQEKGKEASSNSDLIWLDHMRSSYLLSGIKWTPSKSQDINRSL